MKFETEHGCVVSEMATAYGNQNRLDDMQSRRQ